MSIVRNCKKASNFLFESNRPVTIPLLMLKVKAEQDTAE